MKYTIINDWFGHRVSYACERCGTAMESPLKDAGTHDRCPKCAHPFRVPGEPELQQYKEVEATAARQKRRDILKPKEDVGHSKVKAIVAEKPKINPPDQTPCDPPWVPGEIDVQQRDVIEEAVARQRRRETLQRKAGVERPKVKVIVEKQPKSKPPYVAPLAIRVCMLIAFLKWGCHIWEEYGPSKSAQVQQAAMIVEFDDETRLLYRMLSETGHTDDEIIEVCNHLDVLHSGINLDKLGEKHSARMFDIAARATIYATAIQAAHRNPTNDNLSFVRATYKTLKETLAKYL